VDWIGRAQDRKKWRALVNAVMNFWVAENTVKLSSDYTSDGLSGSAQSLRVNLLVEDTKLSASLCPICNGRRHYLTPNFGSWWM
jgi:hypothetical protein